MTFQIKNIKKTTFWFYFLKYILIPIYNFMWEYFFNIQGKILYICFRFSNKVQNYKEFFIKNNDKKILRSNQELKNLCNEISSRLNDNFLKEMEKKLESKTYPDDHYLKNKKGYVIDMFPYLEKDLRIKIIDFATNSMNISIVADYLKVLPRISKINLNLNIPVGGSVERGPMLWHKDDFGFKSLDLFAPIGEVGDENGPFHYVEKKNDLGVFFKLTDIKKDSFKGERNKIDLNIFEKLNEDTKKFVGNSGDLIFIDSFRCYHRGGFCKTKKRIMLRVAYQTLDSTNIIGRENNFSDIKEKNKLNIFLKFILFKYPKFYEKIKLQSFLLKIYRLFHFKKKLSIH